MCLQNQAIPVQRTLVDCDQDSAPVAVPCGERATQDQSQLVAEGKLYLQTDVSVVCINETGEVKYPLLYIILRFVFLSLIGRK